MPAGPVYEVDEALNNPQIDTRGAITEIDHPELGVSPVIEHPLKFANADSGFELAPPLLGEHTERCSLSWDTRRTNSTNWKQWVSSVSRSRPRRRLFDVECGEDELVDGLAGLFRGFVVTE